jgi:hypothetical protein
MEEKNLESSANSKKDLERVSLGALVGMIVWRWEGGLWSNNANKIRSPSVL